MSGKPDESESEYETATESESEEDDGTFKPVFVIKEHRITIKEHEAKEMQDMLKAQEKQFKVEDRKKKTRAMVAEIVQRQDEREELIAADYDSDFGRLDDTDDPDKSEAYAAWKVREIRRLKRDSEEREAATLEKEHLLRRRNMTDEEREAEDRALGLIKADTEEADKGKTKWKFLQKYHHKGVFYMDEDSIKDKNDVRLRNYTKEAAQSESTVDMEKLPKVLQVKNFGKRGRTKYTHLLDQDSTFSNREQKRIDVRPDNKIMDKYLNKRSGVGQL